MIEEPPMLTIRRPARRPSADQIAAFKNVPTGFVVDALGGGGVLDISVKPLDPDNLPSNAAGPALTAGNGPGDIMATLAALAHLQAGDILVVGFSGHQGCASAGDRVTGMARNAGAVALVTDGPVRDYEGLLKVGIPCWCTGMTPNTPFTTGPGTVGLPITVAGQPVDTGDMIVADRDGVVVVPYDRIDEVISRLGEVREMELSLDAEIDAGLAVPDDVKGWLKGDDVRYVD